MMIWKHSRFYNTPARLVVLMREICNDLIRQARLFVSPEQIFEMEPQEAVERLMVTLKVCGTFKSVYFDYKSRANSEVPQNPWRIQNTALFPRLDSFLERCHDLLDLCKTKPSTDTLRTRSPKSRDGRPPKPDTRPAAPRCWWL